MRKILTKDQQKKKDRVNQIIIGVLLIGLMLFSTAGYALGGGEESSNDEVEYNGITFTRSSDYWNFNYNGQSFNTLYNPLELSDLSVNVQMRLQDYSQQPLYLAGEISEPAYEIVRNLNPFLLRINEACLPDTNCSEDYPIKNVSVDNIIAIREPLEGEGEEIYQEGKAIFIIASYGNQSKYADAFLFSVLGINNL